MQGINTALVVLLIWLVVICTLYTLLCASNAADRPHGIKAASIIMVGVIIVSAGGLWLYYG